MLELTRSSLYLNNQYYLLSMDTNTCTEYTKRYFSCIVKFYSMSGPTRCGRTVLVPVHVCIAVATHGLMRPLAACASAAVRGGVRVVGTCLGGLREFLSNVSLHTWHAM